MTNKLKKIWLKMARPTRVLFVVLFVISFVVPFSVCNVFAADGAIEGNYIVIDEVTYPITNKETLVTADLALLRNESLGTDGAQLIYGVFDGVRVNGKAAVYDKIYDMLLKNVTKTITSEAQLAGQSIGGGTHIYKLTGDLALADYTEVLGEGRLIFVAEKAVTITLKNTTTSAASKSSGRFNLGYSNSLSEKCVLAFQGRNETAMTTIQGEYTSTQANPAFRLLNGGSLYLNYVNLQKFKFGASETGDAVIYVSDTVPGGSAINAKRCLYMTNSLMHDIQGGKSPGIFLKAYKTSSDPAANDKNKQSELNLYNNEFYDCIATSGSNYVGGPVIRSFAADNCQLRMESCKLYSNSNNATGTASGGGAIYWKSAAGNARIIDCEFENNSSALVGGAIYNTGNMTIENCRFYNNSALTGGGAIAAEPPRTNQHFGNINTNGLTGSLTLDENTILSKNTTKGNGGAIYFSAVVGDNGASLGANYHIKNYAMKLTIDGATIENNTANYGGGVAIWLDYGSYEYETGVVIQNNSKIRNNIATVDGGAIWMSSNTNCDCKENVGVTMNGGALENNTANNGGAIYIETGKTGVAMNYYIKGGTVANNKANGNGGAAHIQGGSVIITAGTVTNCTSLINGGAVYIGSGNFSLSAGSIVTNKAEQNGGAIYVAGGNATVSGGFVTENTATQSGGAIYVAGGDVTVSGGSITNNKATQNGGGIAVMDGNYYMYGGIVSQNDALTGDGGGIYVSSTKENAQVIISIRSGEITANHAGNSGGALGVRGQADANVAITIGCNTKHNGSNYHTCNELDENCPVIQTNTSSTSGGGIYLAGSFNAKMSIYCLVEGENKAAGGVSASNFMKVEGGTLLISSEGEQGEDGHGNVVINSSIHVTGGQVTLKGLGNNPLFTQPITVNIDASNDSFFKDLRKKLGSSTYSVQYFENFKINGVLSGQYISIDVVQGSEHMVQAALYSHTGFAIDGWTLMTLDGDKHVEVTPLTIYTAGTKLTLTDDTGDIILYANWVVAGYTIVFDPDIDDYRGEMKDQTFTYNEEKQLTTNAYINVGYVFVHWIDKATINLPSSEQRIYTDAQKVSGLSNEHGTVITLIAVWDVCQHADELDFTISSTENSITRQCACLGYTETVILTDVTGTYSPDKTYPVKIQRIPDSVNQYAPILWDTKTITVVYTGCKWGEPEIAFTDTISVPQNAGKYVASVTLSGVTLTAKVTIHKAKQDPPNAPKYTTTQNADKTENIIKIEDPKDTTGKVLEYQFSWYRGDELCTSTIEGKWLPWNSENPPTQTLNILYTNYYVDVRYAESDNYLVSDAVRGNTVILYTGLVIFNISSENTLVHREIYSEEKKSEGITVVLTPQPGHYIYNVEWQTTYEINDTPILDLSGEKLPTWNVRNQGTPDSDVWSILIDNIQDTGVTKIVTVNIHFTGAKKKATVQTDTVKNQVFNDISNNGQNNVTISRDSAYTILFTVENYAHYSDPAIKFTPALPAGTTVILVDRADLSYWSYTAPGAVEEIPLSRFTRMGTQAIRYAMVDSDSPKNYTLQFIVDFSNCETAPSFTQLTACLLATGEIETVPSLPATENSASTVGLTNPPSFSIDKGEAEEALSQSVKYNFFQITEVGISRWDGLRGILIVAPQAGTILPPDARLEVKIDNGTKTYHLTDGKFIVALPTRSGTAYLKLLSDMMPDAGASFTFDVALYTSNTAVGSTPAIHIPEAGSTTLTYYVDKTENYSIHVEMNGALPQCQRKGDGSISISALKFKGNIGDLPSNYTVRADIYTKNKDGTYSSTTQTKPVTVSNHQFADELDLSTFENQMRDNVGSLSLMLRIEIVDPNGKPVYYVPMYFILIDTRQ